MRVSIGVARRKGSAMETTDELHQSELARRVEDFRTAYQARDVGGMLALFADDAELTAAPGTFRGKAAIGKFFAWDARNISGCDDPRHRTWGAGGGAVGCVGAPGL
jgi:ketosteroid isomerase-like protein